MNKNINQEINIDNIEECIYNNTNIAKFTYNNYLIYKEKYYLENKIKEKELLVKYIEIKDDSENYKYINNEHDKIFRTILDDKRETKNLINKVLKLSLTEKDIEKYKENYITEKLINKETDII